MKLVGITQRVVQNDAFPERRDALAQDWAYFLAACGLCAVALPNHLDSVKSILSVAPLSGIILSGGNDISSYGGDAPERDAVETYLLDHAALPVLAVCRGMQMLQVHGGGALEKVTGHAPVVQHDVVWSGASRRVNSYHNFGFREAAPGYDVLARAPDGIVEAMRHEQHQRIGIMWHPERVKTPDALDIALFKEVFGS